MNTKATLFAYVLCFMHSIQTILNREPSWIPRIKREMQTIWANIVRLDAFALAYLDGIKSPYLTIRLTLFDLTINVWRLVHGFNKLGKIAGLPDKPQNVRVKVF